LEKHVPDIHRELIGKCRAGDIRSQYRLYKLYSKAMYNVAVRMLADPMDAEDVLQEAFVAAFGGLHKFREESSFGTWLKKIVVNRCINFLKAKNEMPDDLENIGKDDFEESWENENFNDDLEFIHRAIKELPAGARTVFTLFLLEGYGHHEIAKMLNISESTSKSQYQRAKRLLKEKLVGK